MVVDKVPELQKGCLLTKFFEEIKCLFGVRDAPRQLLVLQLLCVLQHCIAILAGDEHQQDNENQELKGNHDDESFVDRKHGKSSSLSDCFLSVGSFMIPIL